ncbi:MAG TPA: hypothetical protein VG605_19020 [Puia sp.]|nr:hypothetical protein [Puia sp.]
MVNLKNLAAMLIAGCCYLLSAHAQKVTGWQLDKMPVDLETELALSALPAHLRAAATVYLLDPARGYYVAHHGSNGFVCFIDRTDWEWGEFRKDDFAPMAYDAEGARTIFPVYRDVAAMRATGRFTAQQIKDTVIGRIRRGIYKAPAREGLSYMLAPIMRVYTGKPGDNTIMTMSMPHYMFYAPYITASDIGAVQDAREGPVLINPGSVALGVRKGPYGFMIVAAGRETTAKIMADGRGLLKRLADYSPYFKLDAGGM